MVFITVTFSTDKLSDKVKQDYKHQNNNIILPSSLTFKYKDIGYPKQDMFTPSNTIRVGADIITTRYSTFVIGGYDFNITFKLSDIIAVNDTVCSFTDTLEDLDRYYILFYTESINKHHPEYKQVLDSKNDIIISNNEQINTLQDTINRLTNEFNSVNNTIASTVEELLSNG